MNTKNFKFWKFWNSCWKEKRILKKSGTSPTHVFLIFLTENFKEFFCWLNQSEKNLLHWQRNLFENFQISLSQCLLKRVWEIPKINFQLGWKFVSGYSLVLLAIFVFDILDPWIYTSYDPSSIRPNKQIFFS